MGTVETGLNVEFWFRQIYDLFFSHGVDGYGVQAATIWTWITYASYVISLIGIFVIVYATIKLFDLRHHEEEQLETLIVSPEAEGEDPRWAHIATLMESTNQNDWRQAIIEADILLDEILTRQGYAGDGVAEKLKQIEASDFASLNDAWEAHKVRNEIAHSGSSFELSESFARRTMARYENVFREFKLI